MDTVELKAKLEQFCGVLEQQHYDGLKRLYEKHPDSTPRYPFRYNVGYKYARIYHDTGNQKLVDYFVDVRTGDIYDAKSWTQANTRRWYGTLESLPEWNWTFKPARPLPGTDSEQALYEREISIKESYQKRGRKPKK